MTGAGPPTAFAALAAETACAALAAAGERFTPEQVRIEEREHRWLARLPGLRVAWFVRSPEGLESLATERRVLRLLEARCSFGAPRILYEAPGGELDLRSMVPGRADPWNAFDAVRRQPDVAARIGAAIGAILAEQHSRVTAADAAGWLPARPSWPEPREWVRERLPSVVADPELHARADAVMRAYEETPVAADDRVLAHCDLGLHNLAIDAESHAVRGVFDYEGAAWADRHHDFRYLVLDYESYPLLDAALAAYEPAVRRTIDRERVLLYNAACAVTFLAFRIGRRPEERWCGRTLDEDLRWSGLAMARVLDG